MPTISGYGLTSLSATVNLNLAKSQGRLQTDVSRLSSGLRINSAADDPSGLAIAEGLQAKVNGFDQAASNVQDATNALTVADGALQTVTDILQRLRSLTVQANDDLLSTSDRSDIQTESTQLQSEINTIAESTNFNGISLLNRGITPAPPTVSDSTFETPNVGHVGNGGWWDPAGSSWTWTPSPFTGSSGAGIFNAQEMTNYPANPGPYGYNNLQLPPSGSTQIALLSGSPASFSQSVPGFTAGDSYAISLNASQAATNSTPSSFDVLLDGKILGSYQPSEADPLNPEWAAITTPTFLPSGGSHTITVASTSPGGNVFIDDVQLTVVSSVLPQTVLQVHGGADEGNVLGVVLPTVSATALGISAGTVASSTSAASYETNLDTALVNVDTARAVLGAQMVRLQYQASNDNTAAMNLTGSESNIRDANIAQTTTAFTADQILSSIGTSVLANIRTQAAAIEKLFQ